MSLEIFSGFPKTTACSAANCLVADLRPPFLFTGLSCILSFPVSRFEIVLERGDFVGGEAGVLRNGSHALGSHDDTTSSTVKPVAFAICSTARFIALRLWAV